MLLICIPIDPDDKGVLGNLADETDPLKFNPVPQGPKLLLKVIYN